MTRELWFLKLVKKIAPLKARKTQMSQLISMEIAYCLFAYWKKGSTSVIYFHASRGILPSLFYLTLAQKFC